MFGVSVLLARPSWRGVFRRSDRPFGTYQSLINERGRMMKKLLLGSTALVVGGVMAAPAMAADPIKMGIGGYYTFYALAGNVDSSYAYNGSFTNYKGLAFTQEGEIHFIGQTKLDNGTSAALIGWGAIQHNHNWANTIMMANNKAYARTMATTITPTWQDLNRINYFTPRFQGLQIGVGYAPKIISATGAGQLAAGPGGQLGCGFNNAININNCPTADYAWQDAFDIGANYLNKFGDFTVALYGAFAYASFVPGYQPFAASANQATGANLTAWKQWVAGAQFGFAGFTVGGAIGWDNNGLGANYFTGIDNDTRFYTAGIMYETGPWQMSFMWAGFYNTNGNGNSNLATISTGTNVGTNTACGGVPGVNSSCFSGNPATSLFFGSNTVNKWEIGANYALGPGVKITGGAVMFNAGGPTNNTSGSSWAFLLGMDLRF